MSSSSSDSERTELVFLLRSLGRGGAERQVVTLANGLRSAGYRVKVMTFYAGGALLPDLLAAGVEVVCLDKTSRWDVLAFAIRLIRRLRRERPVVLHAYLTVPNAIAVMIKPFLPDTRIVWGVRASDMNLEQYDGFARATDLLERLLARYADLIIFNSQTGLEYARRRGMRSAAAVVIQNGIDTQRFHPDRAAGKRVREEWGLGVDEPLIGLVARIDPIKGHHSFLEAARIVATDASRVRFVCVGDGDVEQRRRLVELSARLGLGDRLRWVAGRGDINAVYNALDISCSASLGEGFSNSIAEAMACATPCVVTDVGDSARVVADTGVVVPAGDSPRLAQGLLALLQMSQERRSQLGAAARARIEAEFSTARLVARSAEALRLRAGIAT